LILPRFLLLELLTWVPWGNSGTWIS
jgi:hypothetical protein